jgi:hypothetical protein
MGTDWPLMAIYHSSNRMLMIVRLKLAIGSHPF